MRRLFFLTRRAVAALLLLAGGLPAAVELSGHRPGAGEPLHHVEAASVVHHGDHCLVSSIAAQKIVPMAVPPAMVVAVEPGTVEAVRIAVRSIHPQHRVATSRAPPVLL